MSHLGRRRGFKSWFVEPYVQVKLGLMFLLLNLLFAGSILGIFGYYVADIYQTMVVYFQLTHEQSTEILQKFQVPIIVGALMILLFVTLSILVAVRYTHKIYGPLVSINRCLDDYIQGLVVSPIVLRETDQLKDLVEKINRIISVRNHDVHPAELKIFGDMLDELLSSKASEQIAHCSPDKLLEVSEKLDRLASKLETIAESKVGT